MGAGFDSNLWVGHLGLHWTAVSILFTSSLDWLSFYETVGCAIVT